MAINWGPYMGSGIFGQAGGGGGMNPNDPFYGMAGFQGLSTKDTRRQSQIAERILAMLLGRLGQAPALTAGLQGTAAAQSQAGVRQSLGELGSRGLIGSGFGGAIEGQQNALLSLLMPQISNQVYAGLMDPVLQASSQYSQAALNRNAQAQASKGGGFGSFLGSLAGIGIGALTGGLGTALGGALGGSILGGLGGTAANSAMYPGQSGVGSGAYWTGVK